MNNFQYITFGTKASSLICLNKPASPLSGNICIIRNTTSSGLCLLLHTQQTVHMLKDYFTFLLVALALNLRGSHFSCFIASSGFSLTNIALTMLEETIVIQKKSTARSLV